MELKFKNAVKLSSGNIMTPQGRMMWPKLVTPGYASSENTEEENKKWQVTLLFPKGVDLSLIESAVEELANQNLTAKQRETVKWKSPFKKTLNASAKLHGYADEYPYALSFSTRVYNSDGSRRKAPEIILSDGTPVTTETELEEIYSGRWARVSFNPFWYPRNPPGASFGLVNGQILWNDAPLAGAAPKALSEFEPVDTSEDDDVDPMA